MRPVRGGLTTESFVISLMIAIILFLMTACSNSGGGGSEGDGAGAGMGSIAFSLKIQDKPDAENVLLARQLPGGGIDCEFHQIDEIEAYVNDETGSEIARGGPWPCDQHGSTIGGVPPGDNREIIVTARGEPSLMGKSNPIKVEAGISADAGFIELLIAGPLPPTSTDETQTNEDEGVIIGVLSNDQPDEYYNTAGNYHGTIDPETVRISADPLNGRAEVNADGTVTYTPDENFNGNDSFSYTVADDFGTSSNDTPVAVTVNPMPDAPVADADSVSTPEDNPISIPVSNLGTDVDGDTLLISAVFQGSYGTVSTDGTSVTYNPFADFNGSDSFDYTVSDGTLTDSGTVTLNVIPVNDCPAANLNTYETFNNTYLTSPDSILGNDTDVDNDVLSAILETDVQNGVLMLRPDGSFTYSPNPGFAGEDTFTYTANDEFCNSSSASVTINVVATGAELWVSDGTPEGTGVVKDINPGPDDSFPENLTNVNGTLFFTADNGINGRELWQSDGTEVGTVMVKDINTVDGVDQSSYPSNLTSVNGTLFFTANDGVTGTELWVSDGTANGTVMVEDINPEVDDNGIAQSSSPQFLTNVDGTLFFTATGLDENNQNQPTGRELWKSDGTSEGTVMVEDIDPGLDDSNPSYLTAMDGMLFFAAYDESDWGRELWRSDGMPNGTQRVANIYPGGDDSNPQNLTNVNGTLFFTAISLEDDNETPTGRELWKSDGTSEGTVLVEDINPGTGSSFPYPYNLTDVNGILFFTADDGINGLELWKSDGEFDSATMVENIAGGGEDSNPQDLTNVNGTLFFTADDGINGRELWRSDGEFDSAIMVENIAGGGDDSSPGELTNVGGALFFTANDGIQGIGLWKSDVTLGETDMVKILNPDPGSYFSYPAYLTAVNGKLFFSEAFPQ
jgi:ELWxxDGT repeat protein